MVSVHSPATGKTGASEDWGREVASGQRFQFGKNWSRFLERLDDRRISLAEASLRDMLQRETLDGLRFLDAGSGSGLFSLAARRLGANVVSFDFDPQSVACAIELKRRYFADDPSWQIQQGSVLDQDFLADLGTFDIVYSWGVLHHTGRMWDALDKVSRLVKPGGQLFVSIYNDQGWASGVWKAVKKTYVSLPRPLRGLVVVPSLVRLWGPRMLVDAVQLKPFHSWRTYYQRSSRGMDAWRDVIDWVGGFPFEVATPAQIIDFYRERGFVSQRMVTVGNRLGCNEFVLKKPG